jgi:hypothetical protein
MIGYDFLRRKKIMSKIILVVPDQHAHPDFGNDRADWLGRLILDIKPDVVVNMGDAADMASLSSYDKGKRSFYGKSYKKDIDAHLDFQDRMWHPLRHAKKRLPKSYVLEGNHEHRIEKALDLNPELIGTVDVKDFEFDFFYDEIVPYDGALPGMVEIEGITFAHYLTSGVMVEIEGITFAHYLTSGVKGLPIGGEHQAHNLIAKQLKSCVVGHTHTTDYSVRTMATGRRVQALVSGVYQDYEAPWAGHQVNKLWWPGLIVLHNVENGTFDPQWIGMKVIKDAYHRGE